MPYGFDQFLNVRSAFGPAVDAGGDRVSFISDLTGSPRLWGVPAGVSGAWPEPVAVGVDRVQTVHPSPRPGRVLFGADVGGNERTQLYLVDGVGRFARPLTDAPTAIHQVGGWHPDGRTVAFSTNERDPRHFDVYVLDVETGERRLLLQHDATLYAGRFSPDGRRLLVQRVDSPSEQAVIVVDVASGQATPLTDPTPAARYQHQAWSVDGRAVYCTTDRGRDFLAVASIGLETRRLRTVIESEWDVDDFAISPDGSRLVYEVNVEGSSEVWVRHLQNGSSSKLDLPVGQAYDGHRWSPTFSWFPDSRCYALTVSTPTAAADIFVADADEGRLSRLTRSWGAGLDPDVLARPELVRYPTFDGRTIPAFVFRPSDASGDGPRATLFYVHGGPESQTRTSFNPIVQYLVHRGFVVVAPNVRGSTGYGNEYLHLDDVERRMDAVRDLAAGAEWAARSGLADPGRIAVMGGSYGGFMVLAALTTNPELWAAGVDVVGIANFVTFLEQTGPWRRHLREAEYGSLERHRPLLEAISPLHKADRIAAPLMVIHGANDPRVPIGEAEQIVATLRARGRPVEYLRFEDEGHGLVKLDNRLAAYPRVADFLERHLRSRRAGIEYNR
jgi:dipeptidyl aminopeptidase/acylaminoacyl peptidase